MPTELIGEIRTPGATREWIQVEAKPAIRYITKLCGDPTPEMRLEVVWFEHELGSCPALCLSWEDAMRGALSNYLSRCEAALAAFENGGKLPPGWIMPPVRLEDDDSNQAFDPAKPLPEPPDTTDVLEHQPYLAKLAQWGLEASKLERSRMYLVERDDDDED